MNASSRNKLVLEHLPLVGFLVSDMCAKSRYFSRDDLASVGSIALITSAESYDPSTGVPFDAYARIRVRGAMMDELRRNDWASRDTRQRMTRTRNARETLAQKLGREPAAAELADALGVDPSYVEQAAADEDRTVCSIDALTDTDTPFHEWSPESLTVNSEENQKLRSVVAALPEKMRYVIEQIYFEDRSVKELAEELGTSHVAVSQHRSEAIRMLHDGLSFIGDTLQERKSQVSKSRMESFLERAVANTAGGITRQPSFAAAAA